ncbi:MAG: ATP-grasp domain-containing protein [Alphaproteobacteria bacterium]|nr:ATP-grasp domain-containing protein [Alphaproteobacteria bacterium]
MNPPFASVLVANRGEIACRIFRTAKRLGMRTIAVYSDADATALHVRSADVAVRLGPASASESYLRADAILEAARATGAAAIHPGYGFLSENAAFAQAVIDAGLIWIGPTPAAIRAMGLKDEAKRIAEEAGVPVLPGYRGADQSEKRLAKEAKAIGFPVLVKAVAGGGGRGIREVRAPEELADAVASAKREALAAFGDDRVLIEKLVERPRHIEVQVFGDAHGGLVHLFERDCSLQRRRQKVIEEAPAPGMTEEVRAAMTDAAVAVARAVGYRNAGTVEFIVDGTGPLRPDGFWFLEMNTRLQVEHPVTEEITGLDLVEWQFEVAAGRPLPLAQDEITMSGWAIEARVCAEDPSENFRPSVGRITRFEEDTFGRWDAGFEAGDVVPSAYDSLLGKHIVHAESRAAAAWHLAVALGRLHVDGVTTNAAFLQRCLMSARFAEGDHHVGWIAEEIDTLADRAAGRRRAAAVLGARLAALPRGADPWAATDGWRSAAPPRRVAILEEGGVAVETPLAPAVGLVLEWMDPDEAQATFDETPFRAAFVEQGAATKVLIAGETYVFGPPGFGLDGAGGEAGDDVKAPLPGRIAAVSATPGQSVQKGAPLAILEAMKMEHVLKAPRDGVIALVAAEVGAQVKEGAVLVRLEPAP